MKLEEKSKLFNELCEKYEERKGEDISLSLFEECVDIAIKADKREIRFVLFQLKCLYDDKDVGIEKVTSLTKIIRFLVGNDMRAAFVIAVLETALDEK